MSRSEQQMDKGRFRMRGVVGNVAFDHAGLDTGISGMMLSAMGAEAWGFMPYAVRYGDVEAVRGVLERAAREGRAVEICGQRVVGRGGGVRMIESVTFEGEALDAEV